MMLYIALTAFAVALLATFDWLATRKDERANRLQRIDKKLNGERFHLNDFWGDR